jgi:hypothetical protein
MLFLFCGIVGDERVVAALFATKPIYSSTASILIEPRKLDPIGGTPVMSGLPADVCRYANSPDRCAKRRWPPCES